MSQQEKSPVSELDRFRSAKDDFFRNDPQSPITPEQRESFQGLKYFPENPDLRFTLRLETFSDKDQIQMQTSTGDIQTYTRVGQIRFQVDGQEAALTVYGDRHGFFLPFVDQLAGKETYGAGRYLEPEVSDKGEIEVDFNLAYNPYCAYNDLYSCPLTPFENRLKVPIRAGERLFHDPED